MPTRVFSFGRALHWEYSDNKRRREGVRRRGHKFNCRPCCCSSHRLLNWGAAIQWLLDDEDHMVIKDPPPHYECLDGNFEWDRRIILRIRERMLQYRCAIWDDDSWTHWVSSPDQGKLSNCFLPIGTPTYCPDCHCHDARIEQIEKRIAGLEKKYQRIKK